MAYIVVPNNNCVFSNHGNSYSQCVAHSLCYLVILTGCSYIKLGDMVKVNHVVFCINLRGNKLF